MAKRPNRVRAILALGRDVPHIHRAVGSDLFIKIKGQIVGAGADLPAEGGVGWLQVAYALNAHRSASRIFVHITSQGGSLQAADRIRESLREHGAYVTAVADGVCASAATMVLMAGDFRMASPGTRLLLHQASIEPDGRWTSGVHRRVAAALDVANSKLVTAYAEVSGKMPREFEKEIGNENPMSLTRARHLNLIHCMEGEERWIGGRPYFTGSPENFVSSRIRDHQAMREQAWKSGPSSLIGTMAFSRLALEIAQRVGDRNRGGGGGRNPS